MSYRFPIFAVTFLLNRSMKKLSLLVFSVVLAAIAVSCTKENTSGNTPAGINIEVGENTLLILNQGAYPAGSTLDLMDISTLNYCSDFFGKVNPDVPQGLGNTGNDMAIVNGKLWVAMNASNQIAILDMPSGKLEKVLGVDSPRYMVSDGHYVYVSSYGGAVWGGPAVQGRIYKIEYISPAHTISLENMAVGYQPEGVALLDGKIYVANSGGFNQEKDNTISVLKIAPDKTMKLDGTLEMPVHNLNRLFAAGGKLWLSTYDTYAADYSSIIESSSLGYVTADGTYTAIPDVKPSIITCVNNTIFAADGNKLWKIGARDATVESITLSDTAGQPFTFSNHYPYGIIINPKGGEIYIADASFTGNSTLHCFESYGVHKWKQTTGIGTGPLLMWR